MKTKIIIIFLLLSNLLILSQTSSPKRELRGVWIASVANIDWPTSRNKTSGEQIRELVDIFDKLKEAGINAVFFHIRTECDALYHSRIEPWSYWLTGEQGKAPFPYFDPLDFAISEAHSRGMELHAWFNPYRVQADTGNYTRASNHVSNTHPEWLLNFGKYVMLDPGNPQVKDYIVSVVADVLTRYDVDGIHFDDYFYPYSPKVSNEDSVSFAKYNNGIKNIDDWRRWNINDLMEKLYKLIQATKPWVKFGISPFGVVENKYTKTNAFNSYSEIYCDPLTWLKNRTVDYITPQIYWEIGHERAAYEKILPWWTTVLNGRDLYVGLFSSRMLARRYNGNKSMIFDQLRLNRNTPNCNGVVFFSSKSITENYSGALDTLKNDFYKYPALPPLMPWKDNVPPHKPLNAELTADSFKIMLKWKKPEPASDGDLPKGYIVYKFIDDEKIDISNPAKIAEIIYREKFSYTEKIDSSAEFTKLTFVVTSIDKLWNESEPSEPLIYIR